MAAAFDIRNVKHCDECKSSLDGNNNVIHSHFGLIEVPLEMKFCKKSCEEKMIAALLTNDSMPHDVHHNALEKSPLVAKQLKVGCNLGDACPKKHPQAAAPATAETSAPGTTATAAAGSAPAAASQPTDVEPSAAEAADDQDKIGANVFTKIKRAFSSKDYVASTGDAAEDIIKRVLWYRQQGGVKANVQTIANEGRIIKDAVVGEVAKDSGLQNSRVDIEFETMNQNTLSDLEASKEFFPNPAVDKKQPPLKHTTHSNDVLRKEMFIILRRSLDSGKRLSNRSQLSEDFHRVYNKVVNQTGADGYVFLKNFFYDVSEAGINAQLAE
jgi:hypothetical protein